MRNQFDIQLGRLNSELIEMGKMVEEAIDYAVKALIDQDVQIAQKAIDMEDEIDQKEKEIESLCMKLLLQQQPVARDLRLISSALKMITDMERIGDQAEDIAELSILMSETTFIKDPEHINQMALATKKMVKDSVDAFVNRDINLALEVCAHDDYVDQLFVTVKNDLIDLVHRDVSTGEQAFDLLMVAKYFERIGDHAVNVAEWVLYSITGKKRQGD